MKFTSHNIFKIVVFVGIILNQQSYAKHFTHKSHNTNIIDLLFTDSMLYNNDKSYSISKLFYNNILNNTLKNTMVPKEMNSDQKVIRTNLDNIVIQNKIELNTKNNYFNDLYLITNNITNISISPLYTQFEDKQIFSSLSDNINKISYFDNYKKIKLNIDSINNKFSNLPSVTNNKNNTTKAAKQKKNNKKITDNKKQIKAKNTYTKNSSISDIIKQTEIKTNLPSGLLRAIGLVESRLQPYAINYRGRGYFFNTKESALQFVNNLIRKGETNFGVGCFQLHYKSHAKKFSSVSVMLDPVKNIEYAAKLLNRLYKEHGYKWANAVKRYHSSRSDLNSVYYYKVMSKLGRTI